MEKKSPTKYSALPILSLKNQFEKINKKFPKLITVTNYKIKTSSHEIELNMYTLNKEYSGWSKVLLSNPIILKNLRLHAIYTPDEKMHNAILATYPVIMDYPINNPFSFSDIEPELTDNKSFTCHNYSINDGDFLFVSYAYQFNAWILFYNYKEIALLSRKGSMAYHAEPSEGFKLAIKMWNQKLAEWKINKILSKVEKEFSHNGYTIGFECIGHESHIFTQKKSEYYNLFAILLNLLPKDSDRMFPILSYEEAKQFALSYGIKQVKSISTEIKDMKTINKIIKENESKKNRFSLYILEKGNKPLTVIMRNSSAYMICREMKEILINHLNHKLTANHLKLPPKEYIERTLERVFSSAAEAHENNELVKYYASLTIHCMEACTMDIKTVRESFSQILTEAIHNLNKLTKEIKKGHHIIVFISNDSLIGKIQNTLNEKLILIEDLNKCLGEEGYVYYTKTLSEPSLINEYMKFNRCKIIIFGYNSEDTALIKENCAQSFITIIPAELSKTDPGLLLTLIQKGIIQSESTNLEESKEVINHEEKKEVKPKVLEKHILLVIFLGIPGIGKSHFVEALDNYKDKSYELTVISSDEIKKNVMDKYMKKHPEDTYQTAFQKTLKITKQLFNEKLRKVI